jgi:hypothetical protein
MGEVRHADPDEAPACRAWMIPRLGLAASLGMTQERGWV